MTQTTTIALVLGLGLGLGLGGCTGQPAPREATAPAAPVASAPATTPAPTEAIAGDRTTGASPSDPAPTAPSSTPSTGAASPAAPGATPPSDPLATVTTAPAAPTTPGSTCTVNINSIPASNVDLDGAALGTTPRVGVKVLAGATHQLVFRADGAGTSTTTFQCKPGETRTIATRIGPSPAPGRANPDPLDARR